jgi:alcohol dehydrogenase class IV
MNLFGAMRLPQSVVLGVGQRRVLGALAAGVGKRALVCTDARLGQDAQFKAMLDDLRQAGIDVNVYDRTLADLPISSIADCVENAAGFDPDMVIGIGGGSCMDMAKVVSLLLAHGGGIRDYYGEFKVPGAILPVIAVPTTSGTGSEVTPVAVVADTERGIKIGISSPYLIPYAAVCDPELTLTCPPALTACSGADAMTHAIEAYTALARTPDPQITQQHVFVGKNALTDHFALLAITSIWNSLHRAYVDGSDMHARESLMLGALAAGCAFGTAGTAAAHALQYPVGNLTHTPHGVGVATLLPYVMEYNRPSAVVPFARIARALNLGQADSTDESLSHILINELASLFASVGIPASLRELGLAADKQDFTAESGLAAGRLVKNNPRTLDLQAMQDITRAAYSGERHTLAS